MAPNLASQLPVLFVDDEPQLLHSASVLLRASGIQPIVTLDDSRAVWPFLAEQDVGARGLDLAMPHISGGGLLLQSTADYLDIPIILMTATNDLDTAVQCMRSGAIDYLVKPVEKNRLVSSVMRALEIRALREEVLSLKASLLTDEIQQCDAFTAIITQSDARHLSPCPGHYGVSSACADHGRKRDGQGAIGTSSAHVVSRSGRLCGGQHRGTG